MPTLAIFIQHSIIRQEKEIEGIQTGKEEVKLSLFTYGMTLCIENPKDATRKLLVLIMNLVKLQDTKLIYRNLLFYKLIMNYQKEKSRKQSNLQLHQKE